MKWGRIFQNFSSALQKFELVIGTTCLFSLFVLMVSNALGRYVLIKPILWADELNNYLFVWVGFLGAAYVMGNDTHLRFTAILNILPPLGHYITVLTTNLIFIVACFIFMEPLYRVLRTVSFSGLMRIPLKYVYFVLPLSFGLMCFHCINNAVQNTQRFLAERKA